MMVLQLEKEYTNYKPYAVITLKEKPGKKPN